MTRRRCSRAWLTLAVVLIVGEAFLLERWIAIGEHAAASGSAPGDAASPTLPTSPGATATTDGPMPSTRAPDTNAVALVRESIANVRLLERFRFSQGAAPGGTPSTAATVQGMVDLSEGPSDPPRFQTVTSFAAGTGPPTVVVQIVIGRLSHVKVATEPFRTASPVPASEGRSAGPSRGASKVVVVDPVMQILEPIDRLGASAFAPPRRSASGTLAVVARIGTSGRSATVTLVVDDATHLIREVVFASRSGETRFLLRDFGDPGIQISAPRAP